MKSIMKINQQRKLLAALIGSIGVSFPALSDQLTLVQFPAGSANKTPSPNVILSIDDSGSMSNMDGTSTARIDALKNALKEVFSSTNIADDSIRLAYQSMNKSPGIPTTGDRALKSFSGTHRSTFNTWVNNISQGGGTPGHIMVRNAGDYLMKTGLGKDNPWGERPSESEGTVLECRRAYHVFMTDGGWNSNATSTSAHVDGNRSTAGYYAVGEGNIDGNSFQLPDGKQYTANGNETKIYYDQWGFSTVKNSKGSITTYGLNTLADLSFYYWATDLQPDIQNKLNPLTSKSTDETFGTGSSQKTITPYWNPKNNPATWQHMITYTIGFGATASNWSSVSDAPKWGGDTYSGDFSKLIQGSTTWPSPLCSGNNACDGASNYSARESYRTVELWHMAINGRGKYFPAKDQAELTKAFRDIFNTINADNQTPITSATNSSATNTRTDSAEFSAGYEARGWKGYVRSDTIAKTTGERSANTGWGVKAGAAYPNNYITTADKLDALSEADITNRLILTYNDTNNQGVSFEWATNNNLLSSTQKALLNTDTRGQDRVNFIRGSRALEGNTSSLPFRVRTSRQGDIVNSQVWYTAQPISNYSYKGYTAFAKSMANRLPMIYVGGNDGMLHGFSALTGAEKIAYIPKGVIRNLPELTKPAYNHVYFVDGSPFTGDIDMGDTTTPDWRTVLVGSLGAGGRGYYVLDVTKPGSPDGTSTNAVANNFTKANASSLTLVDNTASPFDAYDVNTVNADMGHIFATPVTDDTAPHFSNQITLMNNGRWAVVMGNGYNSINERPVLLIQYLSGSDRSVKAIAAAVRNSELTNNSTATARSNSTANGLSAPRLVDLNGDGMPDIAYAGDLKGNLWKFDLSSANANNWGVALDGSPLHIAKYVQAGSSSLQPITVAPIIKVNTRGVRGMMVSYGTGRSITEADRTDTTVQTFYSVLDKTQYKLESGKIVVDTSSVTPAPVGVGTENLQAQTVDTANVVMGAGIYANRKMWNVSQNDVDFTEKMGWYLNFPETGERLLQPLSFYDGSNIVEVISTVPGSGGSIEQESCAPASTDTRKFRTFLNIMDGKRPSVKIIDQNGNGVYGQNSDAAVSRLDASITESKTFNKNSEIRRGSDGRNDIFLKMPETALRPNWRQLR